MPRSRRKLALTIEFTFLYFGLPAVFYIEWIPVPKVIALMVVALACLLVLRFGRAKAPRPKVQPSVVAAAPGILLRCAAVAVLAALLVLARDPTGLFAFPREEPVVWMLVILLYPWLSALPQELIYREYLFRRYRFLIPSDWRLGALSALSFSFLHIVYDNWWAIGLSLAGGTLFAFLYIRHRSLYLVTIEHSIYGWLLFTIGMGNHFYEPF